MILTWVFIIFRREEEQNMDYSFGLVISVWLIIEMFFIAPAFLFLSLFLSLSFFLSLFLFFFHSLTHSLSDSLAFCFAHVSMKNEDGSEYLMKLDKTNCKSIKNNEAWKVMQKSHLTCDTWYFNQWSCESFNSGLKVSLSLFRFTVIRSKCLSRRRGRRGGWVLLQISLLYCFQHDFVSLF